MARRPVIMRSSRLSFPGEREMRFPSRSALIAALASTLTAPANGQQVAPFSNVAVVEAALGRKGAPQPDGVLKFSFPRADMAVTVKGVLVKPGLALGSWVAFADVP